MNQPLIQFTLEELNQINSTIYTLYDKNLTLEQCIECFMKELKKQIYFDKSDFIFFTYNRDMNLYEMSSFFPDNWEDTDVSNYIGTYIHMDDVLSILAEPREIVFRNNDIFSVSRKHTKYYQEFVKTAKLEISIDANIPLMDESNLFVSFALYRNLEKKGFSKKDVEIIKVYQRHLSRIFGKLLSETAQEPGSTNIFPFDKLSSFGIAIIGYNLDFLSYNTSFKNFVYDSKAKIQDSPIGYQVKKLVKQLINNPLEPRVESTFTDPNDVTYLIEVCPYNDDSSKYICVVTPVSQLILDRLDSLKETYQLSNREFEILCFILKEGMSNEEIADQLFISVTTVKRHIANAYQKLGINSQKQLFPLLNLL